MHTWLNNYSHVMVSYKEYFLFSNTLKSQLIIICHISYLSHVIVIWSESIKGSSRGSSLFFLRSNSMHFNFCILMLSSVAVLSPHISDQAFIIGEGGPYPAYVRRQGAPLNDLRAQCNSYFAEFGGSVLKGTSAVVWRCSGSRGGGCLDTFRILLRYPWARHLLT